MMNAIKNRVRPIQKIISFPLTSTTNVVVFLHKKTLNKTSKIAVHIAIVLTIKLRVWLEA
jgi:hypothetical protein